MRTLVIPLSDLERATQSLVGRRVVRSHFEYENTHIFTLSFGPTPSANAPTDELRLTVHCAWRTAEAGNILCAWQEAIEGYTKPAIAALEGLCVASVRLSALGDLSLAFSTGRSLEVWNDAPYEDGDSWVLVLPGSASYAVATRNELRFTPGS